MRGVVFLALLQRLRSNEYVHWQGQSMAKLASSDDGSVYVIECPDGLIHQIFQLVQISSI